MFRITVEKGDPAGAVYELKPGESMLGRSRSAAVHLASADVSGHHARIRVENGEARIENLSQFGTRIDGKPVAGAVALAAGQRIEIGKVTVLRVDPLPGAPAPADPEAATGEGLAPTRAAASATRAFADPEATRAADDLSELTSPLSRSAPGEAEEGATEGMTRAMQTRAATPEEIEHLKAVEQKRVRRRTTIGLSIAVPVVLLAVIFRPRTPPPETEIEWSKDARGEFVDAFEPAPSGGFKDGGYDVMYPGNKTFKKKAIEGGWAMEGLIARKLDVPMRVMLQETQEARFATMSRAEFVQDWIQQVSASGGRWSFDKPSPTTLFFGRKNGVPFTRVTYLRDGDGSWFGVASVVRHGVRRIVTRAEVPANERVRAERILSDKLLKVSEEFEYACWEGGPSLAKVPEAEGLAQAQADIERMAPATWVAINGLLNGLLAQAAQDGHKQVEEEALRLLAKLRERQALWFNSQKLAFNAAVSQNNLPKATKTAEFTKAVFSDINDQRYFDVRKWSASP